MNETTSIRVDWTPKTRGGYTATAAEDKGGYLKGDVITEIPFQMKHFPAALCILVKQPHQTI